MVTRTKSGFSPELKRFLFWRRIRCRLVGHHWIMAKASFQLMIFDMQCVRCYPHRDGSKRVVSYDLAEPAARSVDGLSDK